MPENYDNSKKFCSIGYSDFILLNPKAMKKLIFALLSFVLIASVAFAQTKPAKRKSNKGKLDKRSYTCTFLLAGGKDAFQDELKFANGTFICGIMQDDGFKASSYDAIVDSNAEPPTITFTCSATSEKGDDYEWTGTVTGENMVGKATLTSKKGKLKKSYTFDGDLKSTKKKTDSQ